MRIGIMSDTHGNTKAVDEAVAAAGDIDLWLHAGDLIPDAEYLREVYDANVVNVAGNCDWGGGNAENEQEVFVAGQKIFLTHGHLFGVKGNIAGFAEAVAEHCATIGVFGHSHVAFIKKINGILLINPGSLSYPRDGKGRSFMVLELSEGQEPEIYHYHLDK